MTDFDPQETFRQGAGFANPATISDPPAPWFKRRGWPWIRLAGRELSRRCRCRAVSRISLGRAPWTECFCQPVASTSSSIVAPAVRSSRSRIRPSLPPGRIVVSGFRALAAALFFARVRGRVLLGVRLVMGWPSVSGRAPCAASHHPKPGRDMTPVRAGGGRGLSRSST